MNIKTLLATTAVLSSLGSASFAADIKLENLTIEHPAIRATVPNAKVAGGFMVIKNTGTKAERLIGGSAKFSGKVEIHEMAVTDGIMKMRKLGEGLEIPPGGSVHLKPGSFHVMFMKLHEQLKAGEKRKAIVEFKNAGKIEVEFDVETIAATMKHGKMKMGKMKKGEMDHSKMKMKKQSN